MNKKRSFFSRKPPVPAMSIMYEPQDVQGTDYTDSYYVRMQKSGGLKSTDASVATHSET